jgi:Lhr-like helicase
MSNQPAIDKPKMVEQATMTDEEEEISVLVEQGTNTEREIELVNKLQKQLYEKMMYQRRELHEKRRALAIKRRNDTIEFDLQCMDMENKKMDGYIAILKKKHEIEVAYLEEMYNHKKKIQEISKEHEDIKPQDISSLMDTYDEELSRLFPDTIGTQEQSVCENNDDKHVQRPNSAPAEIIRPPNNQEERKPPPPPSVPKKNVTLKSAVQAKPERRHSMPGGLELHLRNALETKFSRVLNNIPKDGMSGESDEGDWYN